ncbi:MAG: HPr family phosphocarrier protein, partial [Anaeroplasmataceae bacterium]|nr:HPr family phosphocarrier protein [Anaeroplasmataceae bacterium]
MFKKFKITNESGVHARPATSLVNLCMRFDSNITLEALKKEVDCKSIMGVMSLGIYSGTVVTITVDGTDEE